MGLIQNRAFQLTPPRIVQCCHVRALPIHTRDNRCILILHQIAFLAVIWINYKNIITNVLVLPRAQSTFTFTSGIQTPWIELTMNRRWRFSASKQSAANHHNILDIIIKLEKY